MVMKDLVLKNRSRRRFYQDHRIEADTIMELIDLARTCASAMNRQSLKYAFSCDPGRNAQVFPHLIWARQLEGRGGPVDGERPAAYIVVLGDTRIAPSFGCDHGIAAQTILLGAVERGLCRLPCCDHGNWPSGGQRGRTGFEAPGSFVIVLIRCRPGGGAAPAIPGPSSQLPCQH